MDAQRLALRRVCLPSQHRLIRSKLLNGLFLFSVGRFHVRSIVISPSFFFSSPLLLHHLVKLIALSIFAPHLSCVLPIVNDANQYG